MTAVLLSGMTCGPGRRYHLAPADATGRAWLVVDPGSNTPGETPGMLRLCPADPPGRPLRAWGYKYSPSGRPAGGAVPGLWEVASTSQGPHALGHALTALLRVL